MPVIIINEVKNIIVKLRRKQKGVIKKKCGCGKKSLCSVRRINVMTYMNFCRIGKVDNVFVGIMEIVK